MSKIKLSFTGRAADNKTYEVDEENTVGEPHLIVAKRKEELASGIGPDHYKINFESGERHLFNKGVELCRARTAGLLPVYVTAFTGKHRLKEMNKLAANLMVDEYVKKKK